MSTTRLRTIPKQPPHSIEAEQSVLGGLMLNNRIWHEIADKLRAEDFYRSDHQAIYAGISEMLTARKACDYVTLTEYLRHQGRLEDAGGAQYIGSLAADTYSIANVLSYADIVAERSGFRQLCEVGADIGDLGYERHGKSFGQALEEAERRLMQVHQRRNSPEAAPASQLLDALARRIEQARKRQPGEITGISTGLIELDRKTQGLHAGDVVIIAARPGMGKTSLAMTIAEYTAVESSIPTAVFTMEMSAEQLTQRLVSSFGRIDMQRMRSGQLTDGDFERFVAADAKIRNAPLHIDETGALSPLELRSRARRLVAKHRVRVIVIDYLQLMQIPGSRENRQNVVAEISREVKAMAKELRCAVILLSQLTRDLEKRDNKRPKLSDLRDSGGIEQDADVVLFIHREDYYDEESPKRGKAEIIVGKQRSGPVGTCHVSWYAAFCRFENATEPGLLP